MHRSTHPSRCRSRFPEDYDKGQYLDDTDRDFALFNELEIIEYDLAGQPTPPDAAPSLRARLAPNLPRIYRVRF